jgi:uncharacterized protein
MCAYAQRRKGMPPQKKQRRCRNLGTSRGFKPMGVPGIALEENVVNLDEFEAMRLCDLEGKNQIEASEAMHISRGTVQRLLTAGRAKVVDALLMGKIIIINKDKNENG